MCRSFGGGWGSWNEAILHYAEGGRARVLRDLMANQPIAAADRNVQDLWRKASDLTATEQSIAEKMTQASLNKQEDLAKALQTEFATVSQERQQAELKLADTGLGKVAEAKAVPLAQIQQMLGPKEAILEYKVLPGKVVLLLVRPDGLKEYEVTTLETGDALSALMEQKEEALGAATWEKLGQMQQEAGKAAGLPAGVEGTVEPAELVQKFTVAELVWLYRYPMTLLGSRDGGEQQKGQDYAAQQIRIGAALYQLLLAPVEADLQGVEGLIAVPDGPLYYLPFGALVAALPADVDEAGAGQVYAYPGVQYALERWRISYLPSAAMYAGMLEANKGKPEPARRLCAFADPVFSASDTRAVKAEAAVTTTPEPAEPVDENREAFARVARGLDDESKSRGMVLDRLMATRQEAEKALEAFSGGQAVCYETPEQVQWGENVGLVSLAAKEPYAYAPDLKQYGYVLMCTHGIIRPEQVMYSYIALTAPEALGLPAGVGSRQDGRLLLPEAFGLDLNAWMVTLSACETAEGSFKRGEGILGLTAALFASGARAITASGWKVDDVATGELIGRYHELMAQGTPPAEALRATQRKMLDEARTAYTTNPQSPEAAHAHPYYWAPFLMLGQW